MPWIFLIQLLELLKWLIIIRLLLSWFVSPFSGNPAVRLLRRITDPILRPLSEMLPPIGGLDLSPLLAFFAIHLFQRLFATIAFG